MPVIRSWRHFGTTSRRPFNKEEMIRMTVSEYRSICQKGELENYLYDKYIFRRISIYGTILAIKLGLRPNWVTLASLLCALGSLYPLGTNDRGLVFLGCALIFLYNYLDHVDGELARFYSHNGAPPSGLGGQYFDVLCHRYSANLMILFTSWAVYTEHGAPWILLAGVWTMIGLNQFPNLVAAKVMMIKIAGSPEVLSTSGMSTILYELEKKQKQISEVGAPLLSARKLRKIANETLGYPGILMIIIGANAFDAVSTPTQVGTIPVDARTVAIFVIAAAHLPFQVMRARRWIKLLNQVV